MCGSSRRFQVDSVSRGIDPVQHQTRMGKSHCYVYMCHRLSLKFATFLNLTRSCRRLQPIAGASKAVSSGGAASHALAKARGSGAAWIPILFGLTSWGTWGKNRTSSEVSDRLLCSLASGFYQECKEADPDMANDLASASLLSSLDRRSKTKHENMANLEFQRAGLTCPMAAQNVELDADLMHPTLPVTEFLKVLALHEKLPVLWGGHSSRPTVLRAFWERYREHEGGHAVFMDHPEHLDCVLPLQIHADEGETLKKSAIMVVSWSSPIGTGTSKQDVLDEVLNMNFGGSTYATRFLFTVCVKKVYKKHPQRFEKLMAALADELHELHTNGVELLIKNRPVRMFVSTVGFKGDWPIHARVGLLSRHFARKGVKNVSTKSGICHLCQAGEINFPPFDYSSGAAWRSSYLKKPPWERSPPLARIPQTPNKELMHKFDIFHTLHKGCFAELAGSCIESLLKFVLLVACFFDTDQRPG